MFDKISPVPSHQDLLDVAFRRGKTLASQVKSKKKGVSSRLGKLKNAELARLECMKTIIEERLTKILTQFPETMKMSEFYQELMKVTLDFPKFKQSFGAVNWAIKKIREFWKDYNSKIARCNDMETIPKYKMQFFGRISSVIKQIRKNLDYLEKCRITMRKYPWIKDIPTIAIAGFPNVGKTTLLWKLTGSKPDIKPYAFTTKGINVGYVGKKIQILDTPGTLNRFSKMNDIEKIAYLAMKHVADKIIYVFDPTETYDMEMQEELLKEIKKFKKPVYLFVSKTDIALPIDVDQIIKKHKSVTTFSELRKLIKQK